jgi:hypothetical protein
MSTSDLSSSIDNTTALTIGEIANYHAAKHAFTDYQKNSQLILGVGSMTTWCYSRDTCSSWV